MAGLVLPWVGLGWLPRLYFLSAFMVGHLSASDCCVLALDMVIASAGL